MATQEALPSSYTLATRGPQPPSPSSLQHHPTLYGASSDYSATGGYELNCGYNTTWNLTEAQQLGLDLGSTTHMLPTTDELLDMMRALLEF